MLTSRRSVLWLALLILKIFVCPETIQASATANTSVTFTIGTITVLSVSGNPGTLTINTAVAGSQPTAVTDTSTTYSITTNATAQKITAALNSAMPSNLTLTVALAAPTGATSSGTVSLTTTNQNLVTGISSIAQSNLLITYGLSATVAAVPTSGSKTITYTFGP